MDLKSKALFYRNLYTMFVSGIDYSKALHLLSDQKQNQSTRDVLDILKKGLRRGETILDTISENPAYFGEFEREMLSLGESTGSLDHTFKLIVDFQESQLSFRNEMVSAITPNLLQLHLFILVVPIVNMMFLPGYTVGQFFFTFVKMVFFIDILPIILWKIGRMGQVNDRLMPILIKVPIILKFNILKFILGMKFMYAAGGVDIQRSLTASSQLCSNKVVREACLPMADMVKRGRTLGESFMQSSLFPPMVVNMIRTGETSGALDETFEKLADLYTEDLNTAVARFKKVFPMLLSLIMLMYMGSRIIGGWGEINSRFDVLE